jgi:hypothetical protein
MDANRGQILAISSPLKNVASKNPRPSQLREKPKRIAREVSDGFSFRSRKDSRQARRAGKIPGQGNRSQKERQARRAAKDHKCSDRRICSQDRQRVAGTDEVSSYYKPGPPKWWRAVTVSGKPMGLGFFCPVCCVAFRHSGPAQVEHCGRVDLAPDEPMLPIHNLGEPLWYPEKAEEA